jgi:hypothetical protein
MITDYRNSLSLKIIYIYFTSNIMSTDCECQVLSRSDEKCPHQNMSGKCLPSCRDVILYDVLF